MTGKGSEKGRNGPSLTSNIASFFRSLEGGNSSLMTPLDRAQGVMHEAMEEPDRLKRIGMVHRALGISLDCADAYVLLAREDTETAEEALFFYRKAVAAAERVLGEMPFREQVGFFWGLVETRPYMRAALGLASCLWEVGRRGEALELYRDLILLDSDDHLGVRYLLMPCLIEEGLDEQAERLFGCFREEDSASWCYSEILLEYRRDGENSLAGALLKGALELNPYVPDYLTGPRSIPKDLPDDYVPGERDEAVIYASESLPAWKASRGARPWLKRKVQELAGS